MIDLLGALTSAVLAGVLQPMLGTVNMVSAPIVARERGIKVLSLFFIDEVAKYRDYSQADEKGEYACIFEQEYQRLRHAAKGHQGCQRRAAAKHG